MQRVKAVAKQLHLQCFVSVEKQIFYFHDAYGDSFSSDKSTFKMIYLLFCFEGLKIGGLENRRDVKCTFLLKGFFKRV